MFVCNCAVCSVIILFPHSSVTSHIIDLYICFKTLNSKHNIISNVLLVVV